MHEKFELPKKKRMLNNKQELNIIIGNSFQHNKYLAVTMYGSNSRISKHFKLDTK